MKKYTICIILFINLICKQHLASQTVPQVFEEAEKLYHAGRTAQANSLFLRVLCFDSAHALSARTYRYLAAIEAGNKNMDLAQLYYDQLLNYDTSQQGRESVLLTKSFLYLQQSQYNLCLYTIDQLSAKSKAHFVYKSVIESAAWLGLDSLLRSEAVALKIPRSKSDSVEMTAIFKKNNQVFYKSIRKANLLSILLPGAGQLYLGDWKRGLGSAVMVGTFGYFFVTTWQIYGFLPSFLTVFPWGFRYYSGGVLKNAQLLESKKQQARSIIYSSLLQYLSKNNYMQGVYLQNP